MIRYKISFVYGDAIYLNEEQFAALKEKQHLDPKAEFFAIDAAIPYLCLALANYIKREEIAETAVGIVTPPSPSRLRHDQEITEANKAIDLDAQLAGEV